uniref:Ribosomal protein S1 n=1 Tax=Chondria tumulosa TaxID=2740715 RepID=A0A896SUI2_9FLOR|nr:ribosomal protein S1 [Chondria tumulosa]QSD57194.1 ribosomal protein S1 [Chondria tumulosa]
MDINICKYNKINKFAKILHKYKYNLNNGDILAGTIIYKEHSGFLVNIGTKIAGYLPQEEITIKSITNFSLSNYLFLLNTTREFFLITKHSNDKQPILSIKRLDYIRAWKRIKQLYLEDILLYLKVNYLNKGGLTIYLEGLQGFIPKSHIESKNLYLAQKVITNTYIYCKLLTFNDQKNQLILSNKSAIFSLSKHKFKLGELVYGKIILIKTYGVFLKIYNIKALLHVSEIGFTYIKNINIFFSIGKLIKVKIIHINIKQGKLSVSKRNINI